MDLGAATTWEERDEMRGGPGTAFGNVVFNVLLAAWNVVLLSFAWLLFALPVVTWLGASIAMVHSFDDWLARGDDAVLSNFWNGWRRHWWRTLPIGAASTLVLLVLVFNLLFLLAQESSAAFVLAVGTITLIALWTFVHFALVPIAALFPHLPTRQLLRESAVLAFRHPFSMMTISVGCVALASVLLQVFPPLVFVTAGAAGYACLKLSYRNLDAAP